MLVTFQQLSTAVEEVTCDGLVAGCTEVCGWMAFEQVQHAPSCKALMKSLFKPCCCTHVSRYHLHLESSYLTGMRSCNDCIPTQILASSSGPTTAVPALVQ
jgi:hypothetical protein